MQSILTEEEKRLIEQLATGTRPTHATKALNLLRKKTGVCNARTACEYLATVAQSSEIPPPTPEQLTLLRGIADEGFPRSLTSEWHQTINAALDAAGIHTRHLGELRVQCAVYLSQFDPAPQLSALHWRALRLYADGKPAWAIADILASEGEHKKQFIRPDILIREGCDALKVTSRGRGVQRRLVGIALERIERDQKPAPKATQYDLNSY